MTITASDLRALFARSGNRCAFPGCKESLVADDNLFIGQICHIEAASPEGPRYNPFQTAENRHGYNNLFLLCYPHHRRVDADPSTYSVDRLTEIKEAHESYFVDKLFTVRQDFIDSVLVETEEYWRQLAIVQRLAATVHEYPIQIDINASYTEVIDALRDIHQDIDSLIISLADEGRTHTSRSNPWEATHIYLPNLIRLAAMHVCQLEVKYLSTYLHASPNDSEAIARFHKAKTELAHSTKVAGYVD